MQEDLIDILLRYGLFIGAIFQLVCIGAVILLPDTKDEYFHDPIVSPCSSDDDGVSETSGSPSHIPGSRSSRKKDKRKRR